MIKKLFCDITGYNKKPQNKHPFCFKLEGQPRQGPGRRTLFDGDSICHTMNVETWFGPGATNYAVGGSTTADILARISDVAKAAPYRICVSVCGNDVLRLYDKDQTLENLRKIYEQYLKITPRVYQISIPWLGDGIKVPGNRADLKRLLFLIYSGLVSGVDFSEWISHQIAFPVPGQSYNILTMPMNLEIKKLCDKMGVVYVDITTPLMMNYKKYEYDGIHPNTYGMQLWTDKLKGVILWKEGAL